MAGKVLGKECVRSLPRALYARVSSESHYARTP